MLDGRRWRRRRHRHLRSVGIGQRRRGRAVAVGDRRAGCALQGLAAADRSSIRHRWPCWPWPCSASDVVVEATEPSPFASSLPNTCRPARLVPPAPSASRIRSGDLAVTVAVDLREQVFQRVVGGCRVLNRETGFALEQRAHRLRRYLRTPPDRKPPSSRDRRPNRFAEAWLTAGGLRRRRLRRRQRLEGVECGRRGAKSKQHGRTPTSAAKRGQDHDPIRLIGSAIACLRMIVRKTGSNFNGSCSSITSSKPRAIVKNPVK